MLYFEENIMKKNIVSIMLSLLTGAAIGGGVVGKKVSQKAQKHKEYADKHLALFLMMNQWVKMKQEGKNLSFYFEKNGYKKIAIYGMSYAGETLIDELRDTNIEIAYGIDKRADLLYADLDIVTIDDLEDDADVIVVTAITFFDEIERVLSSKVNCPIVSLEDILYEL